MPRGRDMNGPGYDGPKVRAKWYLVNGSETLIPVKFDYSYGPGRL
jgi:hypothetical protein